MATCKTCKGEGSVKCPKCNGKGRVGGGVFSSSYECKHCSGSGVKKCGACNLLSSMKIRNFVVLGLFVVAVLVGSGCGSIIKTGGNSFVYGTFPLGANASSTKIIIVNQTRGLLDVFWDEVQINLREDRTTPKPIGPGEIFRFENNTAWVGETVCLNVQVWDSTHSRIIGHGSRIFPVHFRRGVVSINWIFQDNIANGEGITNYVQRAR